MWIEMYKEQFHLKTTTWKPVILVVVLFDLDQIPVLTCGCLAGGLETVIVAIKV